MKFLDDVDEEFGPLREGETQRFRKSYESSDWPWDAFPTVCEACGREMKNPTRQIFTDEILVVRTGVRAGEEFVRRDLPVGALWEISHYREFKDWCGPGGIAVSCMLPGGEWHVDGRATNCTLPGDTRHRCWVRHGNIKGGYLHVDKDGGGEFTTCSAGAGSIQMNGPNGWHGFVHRGHVTEDRDAVDRMLDGPPALAPAERVLTVVQLDQIAIRRAARKLAPVKVRAPRAGAARGWRSNR